MPIPNRTFTTHYHYHIYDYAGSDQQPDFALSPLMGVAGYQMNFYSLVRDLHALRDAASLKNIPVALDPLDPQTPEGRRIYVLSFGGDVNRPVLFTGGIHGLERIAVEIPYLIAEYLIKNYPHPVGPATTAKELVIKRLVDHRSIVVAPMLNPDGHYYATMTDREWRINRRPFNPNTDFTPENGYQQNAANLSYLAAQHNPPAGVQSPRQIDFALIAVTDGADLNRNFPGTKWGYECYKKEIDDNGQVTYRRSASGDPVKDNLNPQERETYFGPFRNSEPETQAVMQLFTGYGPFLASIDYHSFGRMIIYPDKAKNDSNVPFLAKCLSELIRNGLNKDEESYEYGETSKIMYPAFSSVMDYSYQTAPQGLLARKPYAFTIELDPNKQLPNTPLNQGFNLTEDRIKSTFERNIRGALALIACAGKPLYPPFTPQACRQFAKWDVFFRGNNLPA